MTFKIQNQDLNFKDMSYEVWIWRYQVSMCHWTYIRNPDSGYQITILLNRYQLGADIDIRYQICSRRPLCTMHIAESDAIDD